jgi:hypothetical protein
MSGPEDAFGLTRIPDTKYYNQKLKRSLDWKDHFLFSPSKRSAFPSAIFIPEVYRPKPGDWKEHWRLIQKAFADLAAVAVRSDVLALSPEIGFSRMDSKAPFRYAPDLRAWRDVICGVKPARRSIYSLLHTDIGVWSYLACSADFIAGHPGRDEEDLDRLISQEKYFREIVGRFFDYANARRAFHARVLVRVAKILRCQPERVSKESLDKLIDGRPMHLSEPRLDEELWLCLIWPIACRNLWSFTDVWRATQEHFLERNALRTKADANKMRQRCRRVNLILPERSGGKRNCGSDLPMGYSVAHSLYPGILHSLVSRSNKSPAKRHG